MRLFRFPKRKPLRPDEESAFLRFIRYVIIALLFCAVIWGFWMNNQRRMEMLKKPSASAIDQTEFLSKEQERQLADFQEQFNRAYGIELRIGVTRDPTFSSLLAGGRGAVLLGLAPDSGGVLFESPPLALAALGEPLSLYIRHVHFVPYFISKSWPQGLESALNLIARRLDSVLTKNGPTAP